MFDQFIGVKPVEERHRFDVARLEQFLRGKIEDWRGALTVEQFKGGQSNPTYRITAGARRYVLRRKPPGKLLPSAHAVEREYKVIKALHGVGFPVARPWVLCEDESVIGTAFYVMDCVEGRVLWDQALPGMSRERARRDLGRAEPRDRAAAHDRLQGRRPRGFRQAGQLHRAPGLALDQAVPGLRDGEDRGDGPAHRVAAEEHPGGRRDLGGPRRLSPGQHHLPSHRAAHPRGARLGTVDARRIRSPTSPTTA